MKSLDMQTSFIILQYLLISFKQDNLKILNWYMKEASWMQERKALEQDIRCWWLLAPFHCQRESPIWGTVKKETIQCKQLVWNSKAVRWSSERWPLAEAPFTKLWSCLVCLLCSALSSASFWPEEISSVFQLQLGKTAFSLQQKGKVYCVLPEPEESWLIEKSRPLDL